MNEKGERRFNPVSTEVIRDFGMAGGYEVQVIRDAAEDGEDQPAQIVLWDAEPDADGMRGGHHILGSELNSTDIDTLATAALAVFEALRIASEPRRIASLTPKKMQKVLLFCPEQGGWRTGFWLGDRWYGIGSDSAPLRPTHWLAAPPIPQDL